MMSPTIDICDMKKKSFKHNLEYITFCNKAELGYSHRRREFSWLGGGGAVGYLLLTCDTYGCSAASNWKPGPHAVSTIVKCLQSPGCC